MGLETSHFFFENSVLNPNQKLLYISGHFPMKYVDLVIADPTSAPQGGKPSHFSLSPSHTFFFFFFFARAFVINIYIIFAFPLSRYSRPFSDAVSLFLLGFMLTLKFHYITTSLFLAFKYTAPMQSMIATCSWSYRIAIFNQSKGSLNAAVWALLNFQSEDIAPSFPHLICRQRTSSELPRVGYLNIFAWMKVI